MGEEDASLSSSPHTHPVDRPREPAVGDHGPAVEEDPEESSGEDRIEGDSIAYGKEERLVGPPSHLPQPQAPPGLIKARSTGPDEERLPIDRSVSLNSTAATVDVSAIGKYLHDRGSVFSAAIAKRISSLKVPPSGDGDCGPNGSVTEFSLSGLKVIVRLKGENEQAEAEPEGGEIKGRVSFFSRSGCRDCRAVRSFFREQGLPYVEINVDVFPERQRELVERTGSAAVPAIFFNEKLLGELVALNSLRNSGEFERRLRDMAGGRCPDAAPRVPAYGFDDEEELRGERPDAMVAIARILRHRLPIQDRITRMKLVRNCFSGSDMVETIINHLDCGRKKVTPLPPENDFEDGKDHFYCFLEHEPVISKCFNFRGSTNDNEPKPATIVGQRLTKLMTAILEAYASDDRRHLDYGRIGASEEFRRIGQPGVIDRRAFYTDFQYIVGGYPFSLSSIKDGILRSNRRQPYSLLKPFSASDKRLEVPIVLRYSADFGEEKDILSWILNYLDATKAGLLTHLLNDGGHISISYQNFDWSLNH
ncbi:hypothetical protein B296_00024953 [Ensete ventricosum]|uniref:Glutaredoxin domain-containing protein n=1 Tax=Ensete ventricosum TaxID=4639 RepID=A0A427AE78_ENSVE|nr:hypothetical protein B296_00024953 [Ensete ventricosum]